MSEQNYNSMLHAYAAGCLDSEELAALIEHIRQGGQISQKELGELQNVISLLPTILELEHPQPQVKDKIARKLYRLRDELRAKRQTEIRDFPPLQAQEEKKTKTLFEQPEKATPEVTPQEEMDRQLIDKFEIKEEDNFREPEMSMEIPPEVSEEREAILHQDYSRVEPAYMSVSEFEQPEETVTEREEVSRKAELPASSQDKPRAYVLAEDIEDEAPAQRKSASILYSFFVLIFSALMVFGIYYLLSSEIRKNREQITSLNSQVTSLNNEINRLERNQRISALLNAKDARVVNLDGTIVNTNGFGRLTLSGDLREGVIRFYNMPKLTQNQVYQLWLTSRGQAFSLGVFKVSGNGEYMPVNPLPDIPPANIESFIVTVEEGNGSSTPSGSIYLSSAESQSPRKRTAAPPAE